MSEYPETGGWVVTEGWSPVGTMCLKGDAGGYDLVHSDNPLTVSQLLRLSILLSEAAAELTAKLLEEN